jgi:hypothetical protein
VALITVDGGSWWSPTGEFLQAGVHETNDPDLIEAALADSTQLDWLTVTEPEVEQYAAQLREQRRGAVMIQDALPADPQTPGPLTSADLDPEKIADSLACPLCEGRTFRTRAALVSHRRNAHPELDPGSGAPKTVEDGSFSAQVEAAPPLPPQVQQ